MDAFTKLLVLLFYAISILRISLAVDTITANQHVKDGETIISAGGSFELGFFRPGSSKNRYVGIWYKKVASGTVVWVANREMPLTDSSGVLKVTSQGILVILNGTNSIIWSSNASRSAQNPTAQLLESGNLAVKNGNDDDPENFLWQSFDYPCDTILPGMKLGRNMVTGLDWYLSSWKSSDDPSRSNFTYALDPSGYPQLLLRNDSAVIFRSGPWNGLRFSGFPELRPNPVFIYSFVINEREMYFTYELVNSSVLSRLVLVPNGNVQRFIWVDRTNSWSVYSTASKDDCDSFSICGAYSTCYIFRSPRCECIKGFVPKFPQQWDRMDWSNGCVRSTSLDCQKGDGFTKVSGVKLPDTRNTSLNEIMNFEDCASMCLRDCSCTAYANSNISGEGSGCLLWFDDLIDIKELTENGQDFYIRMAASELDVGSKVKKRRWVIVSTVSIVGMILLGLVVILYALRKKRLKRKGKTEDMSESAETNERQEDLQLPLFDLDTILNATNNFSINNKLGEGGFGPVYKGMLQDGKEIAIKRLSKDSMQGLDEFKNEVIYISKLQHRNLVKLLGCCIHGEEKMLIYEYMPNKSLDFFIFDQTQSMVLDWPMRLAIINGIARGLLYLHQDSRLRIIHRDIKADNILLDKDMSSKISDFGMARSFGGNDIEANTRRVVGTFGYMSPEYASDGVYSVKSDVFSFGVLMLEIIIGKRNRGFNHPDHRLNLLGHAWTLHMEGRPLELIDTSLGDTYNQSEALHALNVGLLCVQCDPDDRPNISSVVLMLGSEGTLPQPKEPGFFNQRIILEANSSLIRNAVLSGYEYTITTLIEGR